MATDPTVGGVAAARVGRLRAGRVVAFMVQWGICSDELGRAPTIEEYADFWGENWRTVYRHQATFREAFPGETTPDRLLAATRHGWDRRRGAAGLGVTPLAA